VPTKGGSLPNPWRRFPTAMPKEIYPSTTDNRLTESHFRKGSTNPTNQVKHPTHREANSP
jgi:hypothetical protein